MVRCVASTRRTFLFDFHTGSYRCLNEIEFRECAALLLPPTLLSQQVAAKGEDGTDEELHIGSNNTDCIPVILGEC